MIIRYFSDGRKVWLRTLSYDLLEEMEQKGEHINLGITISIINHEIFRWDTEMDDETLNWHVKNQFAFLSEKEYLKHQFMIL